MFCCLRAPGAVIRIFTLLGLFFLPVPFQGVVFDGGGGGGRGRGAMHTFTAPILPSSSIDVFGSVSPLSGLAPLKRFPGENALSSQFFSPSSLREFSRPLTGDVRVRVTRPILGASRHDEEGEDKGWFRPGGGRGRGQFRGGENDGGFGAGRGRGVPPRGNEKLLR